MGSLEGSGEQGGDLAHTHIEQRGGRGSHEQQGLLWCTLHQLRV